MNRARWLSPDKNGLAHAYPRSRVEKAACGVEPFDERHAWPTRARCEACLVILGAEQIRQVR